MDPDCAAQLRLGREPSAACLEVAAPYLSASPGTGEASLSSTSRLEDSPAWQRALRARARTRPVRAELGWEPDRPSPWALRVLEASGAGARAGLGDLDGWEEVPALWSRPRRGAASRSLLDGAGTRMNGAELRAGADGTEARAALHRRDGTAAAAAGIGADGQFLSVLGGDAPGGRWWGVGLQAGADFEGLSARLRPALSRRGERWNADARAEFLGPRGDVSWSSWAQWSRTRFVQPLGARPSPVGPLRPDSLGSWASGGVAADLRGDAAGLRASLVAAARQDGAACLAPALRGSWDLAWEPRLEALPWVLASPGQAPRRGARLSGSGARPFGSVRLALRADQSLDSAGGTTEIVPALRWTPLPAWEGSLALRRSVLGPSRQEVRASSTLRPAPGAALSCELLHRRGSLRDGEGRWYFRLEGSSRW